MNVLELSSKAFCDQVRSPFIVEEWSVVAGICAIIVDGPLPNTSTFTLPPCPIIGVNSQEHRGILDVELESTNTLNTLVQAIEQSPIASSTLVQLVRHNERASVEDALFAESLAYSALQHGQQFLDWLSDQPARKAKEFSSPPIVADRQGNHLRLTLNRPENRNAWSTPMRDALAENLQFAYVDKSITKIVLDAVGLCFGAGGDLTEFGSARDAGTAHVTRQTRSPALLLHRLRERVTVVVHGACVGAGIELPAYASHVKAKANAFFQLPEVSMGLIPGAGGTASILRRVGKSRFNYMALSGERISASQALQWGLIDELERDE